MESNCFLKVFLKIVLNFDWIIVLLQIKLVFRDFFFVFFETPDSSEGTSLLDYKNFWYSFSNLSLPLWQWGGGNVYLLVLSRWKVNITESTIAVVEL